MTHRTVTIEARISITLPEGVPEADYLRAGMHEMLDRVPTMSASNPHRMAAWPAGREVMVAFEANYSASVPFAPAPVLNGLQPLVGLAELELAAAQNSAHAAKANDYNSVNRPANLQSASSAMPRELADATQGSLL